MTSTKQFIDNQVKYLIDELEALEEQVREMSMTLDEEGVKEALDLSEKVQNNINEALENLSKIEV